MGRGSPRPRLITDASRETERVKLVRDNRADHADRSGERGGKRGPSERHKSPGKFSNKFLFFYRRPKFRAKTIHRGTDRNEASNTGYKYRSERSRSVHAFVRRICGFRRSATGRSPPVHLGHALHEPRHIISWSPSFFSTHTHTNTRASYARDLNYCCRANVSDDNEYRRRQ